MKVKVKNLQIQLYPKYSVLAERLAVVYLFRAIFLFGERALEDLNPRHQVLETCVLPTELRAHKLSSIQSEALNFI